MKFPTMLRKMWTGDDVQQWINLATRWIPISEDPPLDKPILLFGNVAGYGNMQVIGRWSHNEWGEPDDPVWKTTVGDFMIIPTHWKNLDLSPDFGYDISRREAKLK